MESDESVVKFLLYSRRIRTPRTPKTKNHQINYDKIIGGSLTPQVREMLRLGSQQRRLLVQGLTYAGSKPNPQNLVEAVNSYLPSVWQIQRSLQASGDTKITLTSPLTFQWSSGLVQQVGEPSFESGHVFVYEVSFILAVRAFSHYNLAGQLIDEATKLLRQAHEDGQFAYTDETNTASPKVLPSNVQNLFKRAIAELRLGAGVLFYSAESVVPLWKAPPAVPLPEQRISILHGLSDFFLCQAHRIFVASAILTGKYTLVPKMLLGLSGKYESCHSRFAAGGQPFDPNFMDETRTFLGTSKALAAAYLAKNVAKKVDDSDVDGVESLENFFGKGVAYSNVALQTISESPGPQASKELAALYNDVRNCLIRMQQKMNAENSSIYFGVVDLSIAQLPPRSQYLFSLSPTDFVMPEVKELSFEQMRKAPPGVSQEDFNALPKEIQSEVLANHALNEAARAKAVAAAPASPKRTGGLFGRKGNSSPTPAPVVGRLIAPPGVDPEVFNAMPPDIQKEILQQHSGGGGAPGGGANTTPSSPAW